MIKNGSTCSSLNTLQITSLFVSKSRVPNHNSIFNHWSDTALVNNGELFLIKAKYFQGSKHEKTFVSFFEHNIHLGLPFQVILEPESQDFGLIDILNLVRSNLQVSMMWLGSTEINLQGLTFFLCIEI